MQMGKDIILASFDVGIFFCLDSGTVLFSISNNIGKGIFRIAEQMLDMRFATALINFLDIRIERGIRGLTENR